MSIRRLLIVVGIAAASLAVVVASLGLTVWSEPRGDAFPAVPTGPAKDAAGQARADLASRLAIDAGAIAVESTVAHTWPDASLGLPEPGMLYAQVEARGHIVTLSHGGKTYVYHIAGEAMVLEPEEQPMDEQAPAPQADPQSPAAGKARADLAARLGVAVEEIAVESVEAHTWPDASLGLPEPGMMYAQVLTDGEIVTLSHAGKAYVYHVAGDAIRLNEAGG